MNLIIRENQAIWGEQIFPCAIGKAGIVSGKCEGDNATPIGSFGFRRVYYRPDRLPRLKASLPVYEISPDDCWSDDPADSNYNRPVKLPYDFSHEKLFRDDHLYDLLIVVGHNDDPPVSGKGSAIFIHLARDNFSPTRGCIALNLENLLTIVSQANLSTCLQVDSI